MLLFSDILTTANASGYIYIPIKSNALYVERGDILAYVASTEAGYGALLVSTDANHKTYTSTDIKLPGEEVASLGVGLDGKKINIGVVMSKRSLVKLELNPKITGDVKFEITNDGAAVHSAGTEPIIPVQVNRVY